VWSPLHFSTSRRLGLSLSLGLPSAVSNRLTLALAEKQEPTSEAQCAPDFDLLVQECKKTDSFKMRKLPPLRTHPCNPTAMDNDDEDLEIVDI
jgi:hypothetical protein